MLTENELTECKKLSIQFGNEPFANEHLRSTIQGKLMEMESKLAEFERTPSIVYCKDCGSWDAEIRFMGACACSAWSPSREKPRYTQPTDYCSKGYMLKEGNT